MNNLLRAALRDVRVVVVSVLASVLVIGGTSATTLALSGRHTNARPASAAGTAAAPAPGTVMTGQYAVYGGGNGNFIGSYAKLPMKMTYALGSSRSTFVAGSAFTTDCPAVGKVATTGWLCIYEAHGDSHLNGIETYDATGFNATGKAGFAFVWPTDGTGAYSYGNWALKVGNKSTGPTSRGSAPQHRPGRTAR